MLNTGDILNVNPDIVCALIQKFKEFSAKEEVTFDETMSDSEYEYDWAQILADHGDDQTFREIKNVIEELEPDQRVDLLALMFIGREDFDSNEWSAARKEAKSNAALEHLSEYFMSQPLLAEYLSKGLEYLGYSCEDV